MRAGLKRPTRERARPQRRGESWREERGKDRLTARGDVVGGFPGFADYAALIPDAEILLTDRYLMADEGSAHGFALELGSIRRAFADEGGLHLTYRAADTSRSVMIKPRPGRLGRRVGARELAEALRALGVRIESTPSAAASHRSVSWESAADLERERVIWKGRATAPTAVGERGTPSEVWLTRQSLLWSSPRAQGVNRIALTEMRALLAHRLEPGAGSPVLYIAIGDDAGLIDLPFIFNLSDASNEADRDALQSAITEGRPALRTIPAPTQRPWEGHGDPDSPTQDPDERAATEASGPGDSDGAVTAANDGGDAEVAPHFMTWPTDGAGPSTITRLPGYGESGRTADPRKDAPGGADVVLAERPSHDSARGYAAWPGHEPPPEEPDELPPPVPTAVPAYVDAAQATIDEVLFMINRRLDGNSAPPLVRVPPSAADQATALGELVDLLVAGVYTPERARAEKARLLAIGEAAVRLRTLVELCNAGHLSLAELTVKRDALLASIPPPPEESPPAEADERPTEEP